MRRHVHGIFERLVAEPEQIEAGLIVRDEFVVGESMEALALDALAAIVGPIACGEIVEVLAP